MSDRDLIFKRIATALEPLEPRSTYPEYSTDQIIARPPAENMENLALFAHQLQAVNGVLFESWQAIADFLITQGHQRGYCDPELAQWIVPLCPGIQMDTEFSREQVDVYAFGLTAALGGIAETGTLVLGDGNSSSRLAALAPWLHIAVLRRSTVWPSVAEALTHLGDDPNVIWVTGPSKTADVEGILIEGVHGPGIQAAILVD